MQASWRWLICCMVVGLGPSVSLAQPVPQSQVNPPPQTVAPTPGAAPTRANPPTLGQSPAGEPGKVVDLTPPEWANLPPAPPMHHAAAAPVGAWELYAAAQYLLLRPYRRDLDLGLVSLRDNFSPIGSIISQSYDTRSGLRIGVGGYSPESGWQAGFEYTYFHSAANRDAVAPPGGVFYPALTQPGTIDAVTTATGLASLNYNVYDIVLGQRHKLPHDLELGLQGGVRLASIRQNQSAYFDGLDANAASSTLVNQFDGAGVFVGTQADWNLGYGLSFYGRARGALLYGDQCTRLTALNNQNRTVNAAIRDHFEQIVPTAELGFGVAWQYRSMRIAAGYEVINWFGLNDTPTLVDDFAPGRFSRQRSDLGLEGLNISLLFAF
jgi:hypothetical protein